MVVMITMKRILSVIIAALLIVEVVSSKGSHDRHKNLRRNRNGNVRLITNWNTATVTEWETVWYTQETSLATLKPGSSERVALTDRIQYSVTQPILLQSVPAVDDKNTPESCNQVSENKDIKNFGGNKGRSMESNRKGSTGNDAMNSSFNPSATKLKNPINIVSSTFSTATSAQETADSVLRQGTTDSLSIIPNGRKAGLSGYVGIQNLDAFAELAPHISWYSDYTPSPPTINNVTGVGMLWGASGSPCGTEVSRRLAQFKKAVAKNAPRYMFGFYEPDCYCADSSQMSASSGTAQWNKLIAPLGKKGTILGSPSMCKQKDEDWLQPFVKGGLNHDWQVTSVHINKPNLQGVKEDIEYYASTYRKPIWVSEFACVHDHPSWQPCTDQDEINRFIHDAVNFFQKNNTVIAYGPSNGNGLGSVWPLTDAQGKLTASGRTYLNTIKKL